MAVVAGTPFVASILGPGGFETGVGARIEVPVTQAIVWMFTMATLHPDGTFTATLTAPNTPGEYNVRWMTTQPVDPSPFPLFVPLFVVGSGTALGIGGVDWPDVQPSDVTPGVEDVARLEKTRTRNEDTGQSFDTFTSQTRPTADEVASVISAAVPLVLSQLRRDFDPSHYDQVKQAVALLAASVVESSFFRNQNEQQPGSMAATWMNMSNRVIAGVKADIEFDLQQQIVGAQLV